VAVLGEVLTAIVTPFKDDGAIDYERFRELAQHLVENGSDGIVVAGTSSSPALSVPVPPFEYVVIVMAVISSV